MSENNNYIPSQIQSDMENKIGIKEDKRVSIRDVIELLMKGFNERFFKSHLSRRNIDGIIRARIYIEYMREEYGLEMSVTQELVNSKIDTVWSYDGQGMEKIVQIIEAMREQNLINAIEEKKGGLFR